MGNGGDQLARGAHSAQFQASDASVSQDKWNDAFGEDQQEAFFERLRKRALAEGLSEEQYEAQKAEAAKQAADFVEQKRQQRLADEAKIKIRAVQDRIIVQRVEIEQQTDGLFRPDEAQEKPYEAVVVAVGPGRYYGETFVKPTVEVGETVVFGKFSGAEVKVGSRDLLVLREEDIFYVKEIVG